MDKLKLFLIATLIALTAFFINTQAFAEMNMAPPKPLENKMFESMTGQWEGESDMMGKKVKEKVTIDWAVDRQFLVMKVAAAGIDDPKMKYNGMGIFGVGADGKVKIWWFDSWGADAMSTGTGAFEGNKLVINDGNSMFNETRTFEVKDKELIMTAKGKAKWEGKETAYDQTTVYKRK